MKFSNDCFSKIVLFKILHYYSMLTLLELYHAQKHKGIKQLPVNGVRLKERHST